MQISKLRRYKNQLTIILKHIAKDNIRDMTFKGYTIIYRINIKKDLIEIIRIFNKNKPIR